MQAFKIRNGDMIAIYDNQTADAGAGQNWYRRRACAASADECDGSTGEALISFQSERTRHPRHAFRWLRWWGWPLAARPCDDLGHPLGRNAIYRAPFSID